MAEPLPADDAAPASSRGISIGGDDLPAQAADWVVERVDSVKRISTDNAVVAVRAIVYGLVVAVLGTAALVLLVTVLVRIADAYLPIGNGVGDAPWAAHLFIGSLLTILGLGAWASRGGEGAPKPLIAAGVIDVAIIVVVVVIGIIDAVS
jgi:hypothetical protein